MTKKFILGLCFAFGAPMLAVSCGGLLGFLRPLPYEQEPEVEVAGKELRACTVRYDLQTRCCLYADETNDHCTMYCAKQGEPEWRTKSFNCQSGEEE